MERGAGGARPSSMTSRAKVLAPLGTFVVVAAVGVTAALVSSPGGHAPATLHLAAGRAANAAPSLATAGTGGGYKLVGTLPSGRPADAAVWTLTSGSTDVDLVARLAKAFKAGTPVRTGSGWRAGGLFVSGDAGQSWWFSQCAPATSPDTTSSDTMSSSVVCAVATPGAVVNGTGSGGGSAGSGGSAIAPLPPAGPVAAPVEPPAIAASVVRAAAAPVLAALGLSGGTVTTSGYGGSVAVTRSVGGFQTVGLTTRVDVDRKGVVLSANGWLGEASKGDSYPLVRATEAFKALPALPRLEMCPVGPDGKGCPLPAAIEVTGAHLGLSLQALTGTGQVLVPSWLFDVKGSAEPLAAVAIQRQFLGGDAPTKEPGTGSGSTEPGGGPIVGPTPEPPVAVPPAEPLPDPGASGPATTRATFDFDLAKPSAAAHALALVLGYSDSSSCPHTNVTPLVKESADTVSVQLEADARPTGIACTNNALAKTVDVTLQFPLAGRKVVDLTDGKAVPLS